VRFLAKQAVFDTPVVGAAMRGMHHIQVDRANGADAYRHAVAALRAGELVGVFPESTISRSFTLRSFKSGAVRMARDAGVPLLPVICWGGHRVWTVSQPPRPHRGVPVTIEVGAPMSDSATAEAASAASRGGDARADAAGVPLDEAAQRLRERMSGMLDRVQRDYPGPSAGAWWAPAHLGGLAPTPEQAAEAESASITGRRTRTSKR
jgi:1-acyl-sn-glycerol-3-phosphate acyltransferase